MPDNKTKQIEIAEKLQLKLLERFERLLDSKDPSEQMSPTDAATLARLLMANGWTIDPSKLPAGLSGILSRHIDPKSLDEDDADVGGTH